MPVLKSLRVPESLEGCARLLEQHLSLIDEESQRGEVLRECHARIEEAAHEKVEVAKEQNPLAFAKVSYEQALKLNCWVWGINFICDFDANRIGKTAGSVFNSLLWMFPNDPEWKIFKPYQDKKGRRVHLLQRPKFPLFLKLQALLDQNPSLRGDPLLPLDHPANVEKLARLQTLLPAAFKPAFPEPSFIYAKNTLWLGAPDVDYHRDIVMPEWRKWLPKSAIVRDSNHEKIFSLKVQYTTQFGGKRESKWEIICKSYESKDTKWSGSAVRGIVLTEGLTMPILKEIRQRFQNEAFAAWDYTPYEARNTGQKSALAHKVFLGKEQLPLRHFCFSGFGIEDAPDFILPDEKRMDLLRMWEGKPEGQARIHGKFFSDSPLALTHLDRAFHSITWSKDFLFRKFPTGLLFRAMDPGYDHPTACLWLLLAPTNEWYVYRAFAQNGLSIGERCKLAIEMSGNKRYQHKFGNNPDDFYWVEYHPNPESELIVSTIADYHLFKTDERNKQPYSKNYIREGLLVRPSITMRPKDRANELNRLLERSPYRLHPEKNCTPGSRVYFLINETGVNECLEMLENFFWARYLQGENIGMPKDELQSHGDDHFDALAYGALSPFRWTPHIKPVRKSMPDRYDPEYFIKQFQAAA